MSFPSPSLTPPSLQNWQWQYNGLTFGHNTSVKIAKVEGMGMADLRSGDVGRLRDHGELIGLDIYGGRTVTIDLEAEDPGTGLLTTLSNLASAMPPGLTTELPLWFQVGTYPLLCVMARPRKRDLPWDVGFQIGKVGVTSMQFRCTDPRVYSIGKSATVGLPNPTTGMTFPVTFPMTFGSVAPSGVTVTNNGNIEMRPVLVITGPVTNPSVQNASLPGSPTLTFTNPNQSGYTVASGDQLVIDLDMHTIQYYVGGVNSGTAPASRGSWLVNGSTWWNLQAGSNLIQFLSKDSAAVAGTCQIQYADAYAL